MTRTRHGSYTVTELRGYAREYGVKGRSKMTGEQLLTAVTAYWTAQRQAAEQAVIGAVKVGALLRHKTSGYTIRVTGEIYTWEPYGALCVPAEYVTYEGEWAPGRGAEYAAYLNECNARRDDPARHPLWQYEAV